MITIADIEAAQLRLNHVITHTPLVPYHKAVPDRALWFKPENFQPIGSFKLRGAYNRIAALPESVRAGGVIAYSSGNHAQGVAYSAKLLGIPAVIVMPTTAPAVKIEATRSYGAEVVLYDPATERREEVAERLMQGKTWTLIPPFDDPYVIAGQGTIGLEIVADLPDVDLVLVQVGGAGLISGVATALKARKAGVKVIGVEPELAADAQASLRTGHIVEMSAQEVGRTIADGVRTLSLSELTFAHVQQYVDDIITVSEAEIREATRRLILDAKIVAEPSGALSFAGYLFHQHELPPAGKTVCVLSGGNLEPALLIDLLRQD